MQFKYKKDPINGDKRVIKIFTWLPYKFDGTIYWLETIEICQTYRCSFEHFVYPCWHNEFVFRKDPEFDEINKKLREHYKS